MPTTRRASISHSTPKPTQIDSGPPRSRSRSRLPTTSPLATPARGAAATQIPDQSQSRTRSKARSSTPTTHTHTPLHHPHHHRTADELALEEAEKILDHEDVQDLGSARGRRHLRLMQAREAEAEAAESEDEEDDEQGELAKEGDKGQKRDKRDKRDRVVVELGEPEVDDAHGASEGPGHKARKSTATGDNFGHKEVDGAGRLSPASGSGEAGPSKSSSVQVVIPRRKPTSHSTSGEGTTSSSARIELEGMDGNVEESGIVSSSSKRVLPGTDDDDAESEDDSDLESDSDSTSDSESDSDIATSDDSDDDEAELEKLLQAARVTAANANAKGKGKEVEGEVAGIPKEDGNDGEVLLDFDKEEEEKREAPIPDITISNLPKSHLSFTQDGSALASKPNSILGGNTPQAGSSSNGRTGNGNRNGKGKAVERVPELDNRPYERELSRREQAAQPRKATASELWATLPSAKSELLPQMKRDYQALALANSLDPKRFMKGGNRAGKVPETFAIGTLIDQPRHLQATTLPRERTYRPGQIVQDLIKDETTGSYAKRKYGDLQWKRMENGRGKGWKKQSKW